MSNVHRIMWLDQELRQEKYPNCGKLAAHFEISVRQANRDLEYLRSTLKAPVNYIAAKRGYIYNDKTFILPNLVITDDERKTLSFLAYRYENYDGTENSRRMADLFRNLSDFEKRHPSTPVFSIDNEKVNLFHMLRECICESREINMSYLVSDSDPVRLTLHPYRIFGKAEVDYLVAYCEENKDVAVFRLDRVSRCEKSARTFVSHSEIRTGQLESVFEKKPFKAILQASAGCDLKNLGDHSIHLENDLYEVSFYDINQLIGEILFTRQWERIISPGWLIDKLKSRCQEISDKL